MARSVKILLWGTPGCGKSTLVERVLAELRRPARGFITKEIRESGRRWGFAIHTLDQRKGILAHRGLLSPVRVGRYRVKLEDLESLAVPAISSCDPGILLIIDEIGKMECLSRAFQQAVTRALEGPCEVLATLGTGSHPFLRWVRSHPKVLLVKVTVSNRDGLVRQILGELDV